MQKNIKSPLAKLAYPAFQQITVLERAAAKAHAIEAFSVAHPKSHLNHNACDRIVKARANIGRASRLRQIFNDFTDHGANIDLQWPVPFKFKGISLARLVRRSHFQSDGGLAFKRDLLPQASQRCDRVKQPSARRSSHGVNAARQHGIDDGDMLFGHLPEPLWNLRQMLRAKTIAQVTQSHAPRLPHCGISSWHRHVTQVSIALKAGKVRRQELASPDLPVGAEAGSIERDADHLAAQVILCHAAGDMRMMMLHADLRVDVKSQSQARAHVLRMQIVCNRLRADPIKLFQIVQSFLKEKQRLVIF